MEHAFAAEAGAATRALVMGWRADACTRLGQRVEGQRWIEDALRLAEETEMLFFQAALAPSWVWRRKRNAPLSEGLRPQAASEARSEA